MLYQLITIIQLLVLLQEKRKYVIIPFLLEGAHNKQVSSFLIKKKLMSSMVMVFMMTFMIRIMIMMIITTVVTVVILENKNNRDMTNIYAMLLSQT